MMPDNKNNLKECSEFQGEVYDYEDFENMNSEYDKLLEECKVCDDCGPTIRNTDIYFIEPLGRSLLLCDECYRIRIEEDR